MDNRIYFIMLGLGVVVAAIELLIWKFTRGKRFYKYIPSILLLLAIVGFIGKASLFPTEGMTDLGYIILAILAFGALVVSIPAAILMDVIEGRSKRR